MLAPLCEGKIYIRRNTGLQNAKTNSRNAGMQAAKGFQDCTLCTVHTHLHLYCMPMRDTLLMRQSVREKNGNINENTA